MQEQDHTEQTIHGTIQKLQDELSTCMKQRNTFKQDHLDCQVKASKATEPCDTPYFKQLVRKLMKTLKAQGFNPNGCYELLLSVSERDLETMEKFLDGTGDEKDELENVIEIFSSLKPVPHESVLLVLIEYFKNVNFSMLLYLAVPVLAIAIFVFAEIKVQASWKQQLVFMFFLCFALSIPWEWGRLYKMELAKKTAKSMTDIPEQCFPKKLTMFKSLKLWFEDTFTFRDDECVKYHEAILVDPLLEVSPSQVCTSALICVVILQSYCHQASSLYGSGLSAIADSMRFTTKCG